MARKLYTEVVEKYPNERIALDAKLCIQHLGKSDEELIREFEKKSEQK